MLKILIYLQKLKQVCYTSIAVTLKHLQLINKSPYFRPFHHLTVGMLADLIPSPAAYQPQF